MKIERILANNAGPFTGPGTNTWILSDGDGDGTVVVIDPGPVDGDHRTAIEASLGDGSVHSVLVTHTHLDHAPMANPLARALGVPAMGYAPGPQFDPDKMLVEGEIIRVGRLRLEIIHTPGHSNDHLCFRVGDVLFSGDHIIGGSSVMVDSMGPYLQSLQRLRGTGLRTIHPGHGETMTDPDTVIDWYLAHRMQRHSEIYAAIVGGADSVESVVEIVYSDVDVSLHVLAARSVRAHLGLLIDEGRIASEGDKIVSQPPQAP